MRLAPLVDTARRAGLAHDDPREPGQRGLEAIPDPRGEVLARRVLEPLDLVEVVVVELVEQRLERGLDVAEVHDPAGRRVDVAR